MSAITRFGQGVNSALTWANVTLTFTVFFCVAFFAPWGKPIWLDEGLHFSMGSMSFQEALQTVDYTSIEINHGQTGVYMLIDWVLMQIFGANLFFLRSPSLVAGAVLLWATIIFLRGRGLNWIWQFAGVLAITSTPVFIYFQGEARPYMPLAAAAVCMLAYFAAPTWQRNLTSTRFIGFLGLIVGATFHPYWIYFLVLTLVFGYFTRWLDGTRPEGLKGTFVFAGGWLTVVAFALFLLIGQLTWMRWVREFAYDPFEMIGSVENFWLRFRISHVFDDSAVFLTVLAVAGVLLLAFRLGRPAIRIVTPVIVLYVLAVGSSLGVSYLSINRSYWIFERQWVAGAILSSIAVVWLFGSIYKSVGGGNSWYVRLPSLVFLALVVLAFVGSIQNHVQTTEAWNDQMQTFAADERPISEIFVEFSDADMVYAANVNSVRGGEVWPVFTEWYEKQAGMRPEFRETNPSWTRLLFTH